MNFLWERIKAEPASFLAILSVVINLAVLFGLTLTAEQIVGMNALLALIVGFLTRQAVTPNHVAEARVEVALNTPPPDRDAATNPLDQLKKGVNQ